MSFEVGDFVGVPATYARGAFNNEMMVSIEHDGETISGFVQRENIRFLDDRNALIKAKVLHTEGEVVLKMIGSFFTTNGIEPFQSDWANKNLSRMEMAA